MKMRTLAVAAGLGVALLVSACATSVGGQAELNPAALVSTAVDTSTGPTDLTTDDSSSAEPTSSSDATTEQQTTEQQTTEQQTTAHTTKSPATTLSTAITSIPGFSADCNQVLAGVTAFGALLSAATSGSADTKVTRAQVETALKELPTSGLPAKAQADVNILRAAASAAAGKTVMDLALTLQDGKVVGAIQDLSTWISTNCS
jgi:hypothetical protein